MDVSHQFQKIGFFFADDGFVAVLKQVAAPLMPGIERHRVAGHKAPHEADDSPRAGADEDMEVVGHQGPGEDLVGGFFQGGFEAGEEILIIGFRVEDLASLNAASDDVVQKAGRVESRLSGHEKILASARIVGNKLCSYLRPLPSPGENESVRFDFFQAGKEFLIVLTVMEDLPPFNSAEDHMI